MTQEIKKRRRMLRHSLHFVIIFYFITQRILTLYRTVMPIGTPFLKEKINN